VTYVDRYTFDAVNPADNTDIFLVTSDDGGQTWSGPVQVNDDSGATDGHSGAVNVNTDLGITAAHPDGRPQYQPSIAVDPATGTVAMSWLDVRDDPSRGRYATYLTTSIDGGQTFSKDVFANVPNTATDAITGKTVVIGPLSDNAATYHTPDTSLSFGEHQGLAIEGGTIHAVWSGQFVTTGNANPANPAALATLGDGFNQSRLTIVSAQATYAAGPRVVSGTMGPVQVIPVNGQPFTVTSPVNPPVPPAGIVVTFDSKVNISSFTPAAVRVLNINGNPIPLDPTTPIQALDPSTPTGGTATTFFIRFASPTVPSTYTIQTNALTVAGLAIPDHTPFTTGITVTFDRPVDTSTFTASEVQVFFRDTVTPLSTPGTPVPLDPTTPVIPLDSAFDGTEATTFFVKFAAPQAKVGTYSYVVGPTIRDKMRSPGLVTFVPVGPPLTFNAAPPQVPQNIPSPLKPFPDPTLSSITIAGVNPADFLQHISVNVTIKESHDGDLQIVLISPPGLFPLVPPTSSQFINLSLFNGGAGQDYINTTFDDNAPTPIGFGTANFNGPFQPDNPLSVLNGGPVNGNWTLLLSDGAPGAGDIGTLISWSMTIQPGKAVLGPILPGNFMDQNANGVAGEVGSVQKSLMPRVPGDYFAAPATARSSSRSAPRRCRPAASTATSRSTSSTTARPSPAPWPRRSPGLSSTEWPRTTASRSRPTTSMRPCPPPAARSARRRTPTTATSAGPGSPATGPTLPPTRPAAARRTSPSGPAASTTARP
jgi:subtilisin-like proprotein convertase family protein